MRVPGNTPKKSPSLKAAQYVATENGKPLNSESNTDPLIPTKFPLNKQHALKNIKTNQKIFYTNQGLLQLAKDFKSWALSQDRCRLYHDYWWELGFSRSQIQELNKSIPEFKELVLEGQELVDKLWGDMLLGGLKLKGDLATIRQRASAYIKEFKEHDIEMMEQAAKIKINAEKDIKLEEMKRPIQIIMQDFSKGEDNDGDKK